MNIDTEAIAWAYQKLLVFGVGATNMESAMMLDRLNEVLAASPTPPSPSRAEFERLIKAQTPTAQLDRAENGEYIVPVIQTMWTGYLMAIPEAHFNNAICVFNNDKALVPVINNQQLTQIGFRLTYKSGSTQLIDRAPDSYEIRECKIERLYLVTPAPPAQEGK